MARPLTWCLVSVLLASGCVRMVHPYPSTWRSLSSDGCNALAGAYENLGEGGRGGRGEALFTLLVAVYDHQKPRRSGDREPDVVTISMPEPGVLEAHTLRLSQRFLARNHEFECSDGVLEFARTGFSGGSAGGWFGSSVVRVAKDQDGWLVVSRDEGGFALLGYVIPTYMAFLTWTRFQPATEARVREAYSAPKVERDLVEVLAMTSPEFRQTLTGFTEFEMLATVRYALRSVDDASLQVSPIHFQSAGCVPGPTSIQQAGPLLPVSRGEGTKLVPVKLMVKSDGPGSAEPGQGYVTVQSALWANIGGRHRLIRSFRHSRDYCYALPTPDSGQPSN